jgi:hypothetical protein
MITNAVELKDAILKLESDRVVQGFLIKQEIGHAYDSINPLTLIKENMEDSSSNLLGNNVISTSVGLATGYLIKKWIIGKSENQFRTILGSAAQIGVINVIAHYHSTVEVVGRTLIQLFLHKDKKPDGVDR